MPRFTLRTLAIRPRNKTKHNLFYTIVCPVCQAPVDEVCRDFGIAVAAHIPRQQLWAHLYVRDSRKACEEFVEPEAAPTLPDARTPNPLNVACTYCGMGVGIQCRNGDFSILGAGGIHDVRRRDARAAQTISNRVPYLIDGAPLRYIDVECGFCGAQVGSRCTEVDNDIERDAHDYRRNTWRSLQPRFPNPRRITNLAQIQGTHHPLTIQQSQ